LDIDKDIKQEVASGKGRIRKCFFILLNIVVFTPFILIAIGIVSFLGKGYYESEMKEIEIITSYSVNETNMIKVVQKGTPFFFSPAPLRIYYGPTDKLVDYTEASVANDGKAAQPDDITIIWESNED